MSSEEQIDAILHAGARHHLYGSVRAVEEQEHLGLVDVVKAILSVMTAEQRAAVLKVLES